MKPVTSLAVAFALFTVTATIPTIAAAQDDHAQTLELYQLQAAFHRAGSVHDNINGDSADVITQRLRDMLSLWTKDGITTLAVGGALDGNYIGRGNPDDLRPVPRLPAIPTTVGRYAPSSSMSPRRFSQRIS